MEIGNVGKGTMDEGRFHLGDDEGFVDHPGGHEQWAGADRTLSFQCLELTDGV